MSVNFSGMIEKIRKTFLETQKEFLRFGRSLAKEIRDTFDAVKSAIKGIHFLNLKKKPCKEEGFSLGRLKINIISELADEYKDEKTSPQRKLEILKLGLIVKVEINLNNLFLVLDGKKRFDYIEDKFRKLINKYVELYVFDKIYLGAPNDVQRKDANLFLEDFRNHLENSSFDLEERFKQKQEKDGMSPNKLVFYVDLSEKWESKEAFCVIPKLKLKKDCVKNLMETKPVEKKERDLSQQYGVPNSSFVSCDATSLSPKQLERCCINR